MRELNPYALWIMIIFIIGYACITLEHLTRINKAAVALIMGIFCWTLLFATPACLPKTNTECFLDHLANISQIILFLLGALAIVEVINIHHGFKVISDYINFTSKRKLLWVLGFLAFFLSAILDNLTTTIVMITLLSKIAPANEDRLVIGGGLVIAANAGGAWTPIGDVTTTMLWIGGQLTTKHIMIDLFLPSLACLLVSLFILSKTLKGNFPVSTTRHEQKILAFGRPALYLGVATLVSVPIFKTLTGLPPFMGVLLGLGTLWIITDIFHRKYPNKEGLSVPHALSKIDLSSTLFFLGILLCIDALDTANILEQIALWMDVKVGNVTLIATAIGLASAVVDNVPLVAASMGMYDIGHHPIDSPFWELVAYCAGTGGSILVIGSAAGVVYMGLEKVDFFWYIKRISLAAAAGYFAGIGVYFLQSM